MIQTCPLCKSPGHVFFESKNKRFFQCQTCEALFMDAALRPDYNNERNRYLEHNNDVNDVRYQQFVRPIVDYVGQHFKENDDGLDFGAGTGPVISKMLLDRDYSIEQYDPFFLPKPHLLEKQYDYIVCCEVIEHFFDPATEFECLKKLLKPQAKLVCMTNVWRHQIEFKNWQYKNDPTHVFIYTETTLEWIQKHFSFSSLEIQKNLVVFGVG